MKNLKNLNNELPWKLVWDNETKDVLLLKKINGDLETINELFESKYEQDIYNKINELGLKFDPILLEEEEWV